MVSVITSKAGHSNLFVFVCVQKAKEELSTCWSSAPSQCRNSAKGGRSACWAPMLTTRISCRKKRASGMKLRKPSHSSSKKTSRCWTRAEGHLFCTLALRTSSAMLKTCQTWSSRNRSGLLNSERLSKRQGSQQQATRSCTKTWPSSWSGPRETEASRHSDFMLWANWLSKLT